MVRHDRPAQLARRGNDDLIDTRGQPEPRRRQVESGLQPGGVEVVNRAEDPAGEVTGGGPAGGIPGFVVGDQRQGGNRSQFVADRGRAPVHRSADTRGILGSGTAVVTTASHGCE